MALVNPIDTFTKHLKHLKGALSAQHPIIHIRIILNTEQRCTVRIYSVCNVRIYSVCNDTKMSNALTYAKRNSATECMGEIT